MIVARTVHEETNESQMLACVVKNGKLQYSVISILFVLNDQSQQKKKNVSINREALRALVD